MNYEHGQEHENESDRNDREAHRIGGGAFGGAHEREEEHPHNGQRHRQVVERQVLRLVHVCAEQAEATHVQYSARIVHTQAIINEQLTHYSKNNIK